MRQTFIDGLYTSYQAAVPANLVGKEGYAVELVPGTKTIQLFTGNNGGTPLGVLFQRLEGQDTWKVKLFGNSGTTRVVVGVGGLAQAPAMGKFVAGGTFVASAAQPYHGQKISDSGANVAGDIAEIVMHTYYS